MMLVEWYNKPMKLLGSLIKILPSRPVFAHCDIPCGIYDPHVAQMAAHTVIRMTQMILDLKKGEADEEKKHYISQIARMTHVKEDHAKTCEDELSTLLNDYFKDEHFGKFPELKDLVYKTIKLTGKTRQNIDLEAAKELLENTQKIAEIFWKTKDKEPVRMPSGYPTEGEIVIHK